MMKYFAALLSLILFIGLTSCSENKSPVSNSGSDELYTSTIESPDFESIDAIYTDASIQEDLVCNPKIRPLMHHGMGDIYRRLNLTPDQTDQIKNFISEHKACVDTVISQLHTTTDSILTGARTQRQAVLQQLKNGLIDTGTAKQSIKTINQATRQALKDARNTYHDAIVTCTESYIANVESILTPDQLVTWQNWKTMFLRDFGKRWK